MNCCCHSKLSALLSNESPHAASLFVCVCVCHRYLGKQSQEGGVFVNDPLLPAGDSCALVNVCVCMCVSAHMLVDAGRSALTRSYCMHHRPAVRLFRSIQVEQNLHRLASRTLTLDTQKPLSCHASFFAFHLCTR